MAYDNNNRTTSLNTTCLIRIDVLDTNDNRPILQAPLDAEMPIVISIETLKANLMKAYRKRTPILKLNATDPDSGSFGRLTFKLESQIKLEQVNFSNTVHGNQIVEVNLFECEPESGLVTARLSATKSGRSKRQIFKRIGARVPRSHNNKQMYQSEYENYETHWIDDNKLVGIYALVVRITDNDENPNSIQLNTRAYIFIALTRNETVNNSTSSEGSLIDSQIKYLRHLIVEADLNDHESSNSSNLNMQNLKFNRMISMFSRTSEAKLGSKHMFTSQTGLAELGAQLMLAINGKNFKYFLAFTLLGCLMVCLIIMSLCMSIYFYRQHRQNKEMKSFKAPSGGGAPKHSQLMDLTASSNTDGSASPSSLTSSELIENNSTYLSSEENLKYRNQQATLIRKSTSASSNEEYKYSLSKNKTMHIYDNYEGQLKSPCHQTTSLVKISQQKRTLKKRDMIASPNHLNAMSEEERVVLIGESGETNKIEIPHLRNQLLVQVTLPYEKKMVASTESLTSYNSSNSTAKTCTTTSQNSGKKVLHSSHGESPNNFKTFKANYSPDQGKQQPIVNRIVCQESSYRTMPLNGFRNVGEAKKSFDQKPLNLPVNELFKRYELKKQAADGTIDSSVHSSLSSLQPPGCRLLDLSSPRKQFNVLTEVAHADQVPDYFFKDEKEYKKFLASNTNPNCKQKIINFRHIVEPPISPRSQHE